MIKIYVAIDNRNTSFIEKKKSGYCHAQTFLSYYQTIYFIFFKELKESNGVILFCP